MLKPFQHSDLTLHGFALHGIGQSIFFVCFYRIFDLVPLVKAYTHLCVGSLTNNSADLIVLKGTTPVDIGALGALHLLALGKAEFCRSLCLRSPVKEVGCSCSDWSGRLTAVSCSPGRHSPLLRPPSIVRFV